MKNEKELLQFYGLGSYICHKQVGGVGNRTVKLQHDTYTSPSFLFYQNFKNKKRTYYYFLWNKILLL